MLALQGIRVLEWATGWAGPAAGMLLADLGAEVIKIEDRAGDPMRGYARAGTGVPAVSPEGRSYLFEAVNRHKRSLTLDLRRDRAQEIVQRLVAKSDVFLTNYRLQAAERMGMGYESLRQLNPKLVYCHISGFGPEGPDSSAPVYDYVAQARAGMLLNQRGLAEVPFSPVGLGNQMGGIAGAYGMLAALAARERTGIGQKVETSLLSSLIWLQSYPMTLRSLTGMEPEPYDRRKAANPLVNTYRTGDGEWLCLCMGAMADRYWPGFCRALDMPELERDPRFVDTAARQQNSGELVSILDQAIARRSKADLVNVLREHDLPASAVNTVSEVFSDPQVTANRYLVEYDHPAIGSIKLLDYPVRLSETPAQVTFPAPELGEHTQEVLERVAGYAPEEIATLREEGVI